MNRKQFILSVLAAADGPTYDDLCAAVAREFPPEGIKTVHRARTRAVMAVRDALWNGYAVTDKDESVWLTAKGWQLVRHHLSAGDATPHLSDRRTA